MKNKERKKSFEELSEVKKIRYHLALLNNNLITNHAGISIILSIALLISLLIISSLLKTPDKLVIFLIALFGWIFPIAIITRFLIIQQILKKERDNFLIKWKNKR